MMCEVCGQNPATLHMKKIVNGQQSEYHLCESCAKKKGDFVPFGNFGIHQLLGGLMSFDESPSSVVHAGQAQVRCENCGMTYAQFAKMGRFGCSQCYQSFEDYLDPLLRRIHGSTRHIGKVPQHAADNLKVKRHLRELKDQLQELIRKEAFEQAAQVRDEIRHLEQQLNQS